MSRDTLSFAYKKLIKKIAFLFVSFAMVFVLGASSSFAAGYSCPTPNKRYTSCNAGYYLTSTSNGNSCAACPSGYTSEGGSTVGQENACYFQTTAGKVVETANSATQTNCPATKYCPSHKVYYGKISSQVSGAILDCPAASGANVDTFSQMSTWPAAAFPDATSSNTTITASLSSWKTGITSKANCLANYTLKWNNGGTELHKDSVPYNESLGRYATVVSGTVKGDLYISKLSAGYYLTEAYSSTYCNTTTNPKYYKKAVACPAGSYCPGYTSMPLCSDTSHTYGNDMGNISCTTVGDGTYKNSAAKSTAASSCYKSCTKACTQQSTPTGAYSVTHGSSSTSGTQYYGGSCNASASTCSITVNSCKSGYYKNGNACSSCSGLGDGTYTNSAAGNSSGASACYKSCSQYDSGGYRYTPKAATAYYNNTCQYTSACITPCSSVSNTSSTQSCSRACSIANGTCSYSGSTQTCNGKYTSTGCSSAGVTCSGCSSWGTCSGGTISITCNPGYHLSNGACVENDYTVVYNANGGTGTTASSSHKYATAKALTTNGFSRTGYTFAGWATSASGSVVYSNGQSVSKLTTTNNGTVTLYAKWTANTFTIKFDANGGSGSIADKTCTYDQDCILPGQSGLTKSGFVLKEWVYHNNYDSPHYSIGHNIKNIVTSGTITMSAMWLREYTRIILNDNGGSGGSGTVYLKYVSGGTSMTLTNSSKNEISKVAIPTRTGYTFAGYEYDWCEFDTYCPSAPDGVHDWRTIIDSNGSYSGNITYLGNTSEYWNARAKWTVNSYTCAAGKYLNGATCSTCEAGYACPGGTWTYNGSVQGRSLCSGTAYSGSGQASCTSCPNSATGYYSWDGDTLHDSVYECYKNVTYTATYGSGTQNCYYTSGSGSSAVYSGNSNAGCDTKKITSCKAGYYLESTSNTDCTAVGKGYYSGEGSTSRTACSNKPDNSDYTSATTNTSSSCPWTCNAGYVGSSANGNTSCSNCGAGNYCTGGTHKAACPAKTFGSSANLTTSACSGTCPSAYPNSDAGTTSENNCYTTCPAKTGYTLNSGRDYKGITDTCSYSANTYTITLNDNNGSGGSGTVKEVYNTKWTNSSGTTITSVTVPTRSGYVFNGYYTATSGGTRHITAAGALPANTTFTANTTLYAQWSQATCSKGTGVSTATASVSGNAVTCAVTCSTGYSKSGGSDTTSTFNVSGSAGTATVSTACKVRSYSITISKNGGSGTLTVNGTTQTGTTNVTFTCNHGSTFTLPAWASGSSSANNMTKSGAVFTGWNTTSPVTCNAAKTITANWGTATCTKGTGVSTATASVISNKVTCEYNCLNGYDDTEGATRKPNEGYTNGHNITGSAGVATVATVCYPACIQISLDEIHGGTGGTQAIFKFPDSTTFYSDDTCSTVITSVTKPTKTNATYLGAYIYPDCMLTGGCSFVFGNEPGWDDYQLIDANGKISTNSVFANIGLNTPTAAYAWYDCNSTWEGSGNVITGACTRSTYKLAYNMNCPSGATCSSAPGNTNCTYGSTCSFSSITSTSLYAGGYKLTGWATTATGTAATSGSNMTTTQGGTVNLYAIWSKCGSGTYHPAATGTAANACSTCPATASGSDGARTSASNCYISCSAKTISNGTTTVVNAKEYYNGSAYPACTFNVNCNAKHGASGNKTANPACTACSTGQYSAGGTATCSTCPNNYQSGAAASAQGGCQAKCSAGTQVASANVACSTPSNTTYGASWYTAEHYVTYGSTSKGLSKVSACPSSYATPDTTTASNHDAKADCTITCAAGKVVASNDATCSTPSGSWYSSSHTVSAGSTSGSNKKSCNSGYATPDTTTQTDHDNSTDCSTSCSAGQVVASAGSACSTPSGSWYSSKHTVSQGSTSGSNKKSCVSGYATANTTTQTDHDAATDCKITCSGGTYVAEANATCSDVGSGHYRSGNETVSQGSVGSRNTCPSGYSGSDSGRDTNKDCYVSCSAKTINNGTTTVVNAKEYYNGSAYPACTFNVNCNAKHGASGNKTANPACTACSTGQYSAGGTATCTACTNGPANSEYTNSASSNSCSWKCSSGYNQTDDNQCGQFCTSGITHLKTGSGVSVPLYTSARTTPALNVKVGSNSTCYGSLATGKSTGALNVQVGSTTYHAIK